MVDRRVANSWAFYDWANSVYPLVIMSTLFPIYYAGVTSNNDGIVAILGMEMSNTQLFDYSLSFAYLLIASISPLLSGIADYAGKKMFFMKIFCYLGALACGAMYFFTADNLTFGIVCLILSTIGFSGSIVFYNSYLPLIAAPEEQDRLSAKGFSLGYLGSALLLLFCLAMVMYPATFGIDNASTSIRISFLITAVWWAGFSQIAFRGLPKDEPFGTFNEKLTKGYQEMKVVWREIKTSKILVRYLLAFFVFNIGVLTIITAATLYGKIELKLEDTNLIITIILIQFVGIAGSYGFSFLSEKKGNLFVLSILMVIWIGICVGAYFTPEKSPMHFYILASVVGFVMGGTQSLARSTYAKLLPVGKSHASYFSFFDVCLKVGVVIGMMMFGLIEAATGSLRYSILALLVFFVIGFVVIQTIPKDERLSA
ncbi:MAG: MFS transporter [Flavobacteriales bacterium]|nr:MFS transporter [Flavobacteriales bacterium]